MYVTNISQEVQKNTANDIHMEFMHIFTLFLFIGDADKDQKESFWQDQRDEKITEKMKDEKKCKIRVRKILEEYSLYLIRFVYDIYIKLK